MTLKEYKLATYVAMLINSVEVEPQPNRPGSSIEISAQCHIQ